ncbi:MAG: PRK06851 family protein [Caldicoprobacterales bacterium]|nr:PRK06851 family protein [Clostridia bacterium]MDI9511964.1 PRK06851 family protein [Bacillota bacterium]
MGLDNKIIRVFPGSNTSRGYYSFFNNIITRGARRIYIIKGGPGTGKSTLMRAVGQRFLDLGYDLEYHHCSSAPDSLDALVIPGLKVGLLDGTAPHAIEPEMPGAVDQIINIDDYLSGDLILNHKGQIQANFDQTKRFFKTAYSLLTESKQAYDEYSSYVSESLDRSRYYKISRILLESIFSDIGVEGRQEPQSRQLFAAAITPLGFVDYLETILDKDMRVYSIKGVPGTGVKGLIGRIADEATERGLYTLRFHCPYEPEKLDMVIIPSLTTAVLNSSQPHHFDIKKLESVQIIEDVDLNTCIQKTKLYPYEDLMQDARKRYNSLIDKAVAALARAMEAHDRNEAYYVKAMDFKGLDKKKEEIIEQIMSLIDK